MYAIIDHGGKQYKVQVNERVLVDRLDADEGELVELGRVLMIGGDGAPRIGTPEIVGARVLGEIIRHEKGPKLTMMRYVGGKNSRTKIGHRQQRTAVVIREIHPE